MTSVSEQWTKQIVTWEYASAAKPDIADIPIQAFPAQLHQEGETRLITLDLSTTIETPYLATTPNLLANYIRICANESIQLAAKSTSEVFYVMRGAGRSETEFGTIEWQQGDSFTLPTNKGVTHYATEDTAIYWVHDEPMLNYLGVTPTEARFEATYYSKAFLDAEIARIREAGIRENRNRNGVILGNLATEKTRTMTHSMWSLYNLLPAGAVQRPHRHNSAAIDLAVYSGPETYTLIGQKVDENGDIINPVKAMWASNSVFVTPPGWWHSHHNESNEDAYVFPVQDAGMHIYMRTLDIQFVR